MVKKIRFPLKLAEGAEVRTLEELREHFDLEAVLGYYKNGKLLTWLEDRYLEGEAEAVRALDEAAPDFQKQLCGVFQVEYTGSDVDLEEIERRQERMKRLRMVTDEQEYIDHIDQVAFDQEDLADLLDDEQATIYLCGEKFTIPASRKGITYVGIHEPAVHISGTLPEDPEALGISFRDCAVDNLPKPRLPAVATAEVKGIFLDAGKEGFRTIQVELKHPVFLDGVRYDHVPVLSAELYQKLGLRRGSTVEVRRVGDVIPSISMIKAGNGRVMQLPTMCPDCGEELMIKNKKLYCENAACKGNLVGRITGFLSGIGMDGYGEEFAEFAVSELGITSVGELIDVSKNAESNGVARKDVIEFSDKFCRHVAEVPDYVALGSLGIPDLGPARAKMILAALSKNPIKGKEDKSYWDRLLQVQYINEYDELDPDSKLIMKTLGDAIGTKILKAIGPLGRFRNPFRHDLRAMRDLNKNRTDNFDDMIRVGHTGITLNADTLKVCAVNKMELVDGKSFDILITGDTNSTSGKMEKARKENCDIYTEEAFLKKYA